MDREKERSERFHKGGVQHASLRNDPEAQPLKEGDSNPSLHGNMSSLIQRQRHAESSATFGNPPLRRVLNNRWYPQQYDSVQTYKYVPNIIPQPAESGIRGLTMLHHQFEQELTHLELVVPLIVPDGPFALSYWRSRAMALSTYQGAIPSGRRRIMWLLDLLDEIERQAGVAPSPSNENLRAADQMPTRKKAF